VIEALTGRGEGVGKYCSYCVQNRFSEGVVDGQRVDSEGKKGREKSSGKRMRRSSGESKGGRVGRGGK
jgi:hypothetical protein